MNESVRLSIDSTRLNVKEEENVITEVLVKEHKVKDKSRRRSQREKNNSTVINKVIEVSIYNLTDWFLNPPYLTIHRIY